MDFSDCHVPKKKLRLNKPDHFTNKRRSGEEEADELWGEGDFTAEEFDLLASQVPDQPLEQQECHTSNSVAVSSEVHVGVDLAQMPNRCRLQLQDDQDALKGEVKMLKEITSQQAKEISKMCLEKEQSILTVKKQYHRMESNLKSVVEKLQTELQFKDQEVRKACEKLSALEQRVKMTANGEHSGRGSSQRSRQPKSDLSSSPAFSPAWVRPSGFSLGINREMQTESDGIEQCRSYTFHQRIFPLHLCLKERQISITHIAQYLLICGLPALESSKASCAEGSGMNNLPASEVKSDASNLARLKPKTCKCSASSFFWCPCADWVRLLSLPTNTSTTYSATHGMAFDLKLLCIVERTLKEYPAFLQSLTYRTARGNLSSSLPLSLQTILPKHCNTYLQKEDQAVTGLSILFILLSSNISRTQLLSHAGPPQSSMNGSTSATLKAIQISCSTRGVTEVYSSPIAHVPHDIHTLLGFLLPMMTPVLCENKVVNAKLLRKVLEVLNLCILYCDSEQELIAEVNPEILTYFIKGKCGTEVAVQTLRLLSLATKEKSLLLFCSRHGEYCVFIALSHLCQTLSMNNTQHAVAIMNSVLDFLSGLVASWGAHALFSVSCTCQTQFIPALVGAIHSQYKSITSIQTANITVFFTKACAFLAHLSIASPASRNLSGVALDNYINLICGLKKLCHDDTIFKRTGECIQDLWDSAVGEHSDFEY